MMSIPSAPIVRDRRFCRCRPLSADHFRAPAPDVVEDHRNVAARAIEMGLDNLQREGRCHSGVECIAAFFQRCHSDGRRDPVRRRDDAESPVDLGTRGEWVRDLFSTWRNGQRQNYEPKRQDGGFGSLTHLSVTKRIRPLGHVNCQSSLLQMAPSSTANRPSQRTGALFPIRANHGAIG